MTAGAPGPQVTAVSARDPDVVALVEELTAELARAGYADDETFGYPVDRLAESDVHLVGARLVDGGALVGIGGVELEGDGELDGSDRVGELKRFYVRPSHRGTGIADALVEALVDHARARGTRWLRLETGDRQLAAIAFYRRHGFVAIPRFGPYVHSATSYCMRRDL